MDEKNNEEINLKLEDNLAINDTYTILLNRKIEMVHLAKYINV